MKTQTAMTKKQKAGKIASYVINILSIIIMLFAIFIVSTSLASKDKGYTSYFGTAYVVVQSDSMKEDWQTHEVKSDNFQKGDVIAFKVLSDQDKDNLQVGDVITFYDNILNSKALNTHRIKEIKVVDGVKTFVTKGDNNMHEDTTERTMSDVQGKFAGKSSAIGRILTYLQSKTGFAIFIVVPCVLIVVYCLVLVVMNLMKYSKAKAVLEREDNVDALKAEIKAQLLKEMEAEKSGKKADKTETKQTESKKEENKEEEKPTKKSKQQKKQEEFEGWSADDIKPIKDESKKSENEEK